MKELECVIKPSYSLRFIRHLERLYRIHTSLSYVAWINAHYCLKNITKNVALTGRSRCHMRRGGNDKKSGKMP